MATIWSDDFENYAIGSNTITTPWVNTGPAGPSFPDSEISGTIFHSGSRSLGVGVNGGSAFGAAWVIRSFLANLNIITVDCWIYMVSGTDAPDPPATNAPGFLLQNTSSGGELSFLIGGLGTVYVGQPLTPNWFQFSLSLNAWHHIVWTTTLAASGGVSTLVVDGGATMTFNGDTQTGAEDNTVDFINCRGQFVVGDVVAAELYFDDMVISSGGPSPPPNTLVAQAPGTVAIGGGIGASVGSIGRWRTSTGINWYGMALVGDAFSGVLGLSDFESFTEYGNPMLFQITTPPIHDDRKRIFMPRFEIEVEAGSGIDGEPTTVPIMSLEWSKDGGVTWSPLKPPRSMGLIGEYVKRLRWLNLGQSRTWIFRLTCTDPTRRYIIGAYTSPYKSLG
jgi:hypothetical protein